MATFYDLEIDKFYLIRSNDNSTVSMVQVAMATNQCVFVYEFGDTDINYWRKKSDYLAEIIEELSEDMVDEYEEIIMEEFDDYEDEEEEEESTDQEQSDEDEKESHGDTSKKKKKKKKK